MNAESAKPKRTRILTIWAIGSLALLATLAAVPVASAAPVVVSPTNLDAWQFRHGTCGAPTTGTQTFELGPAVPPLGTGSLEMTVGSNGDSFETFRHSGFNGTLLSAFTSLEYSTYTEVEGSGGQAIYIILQVSLTGGNSVDDLLFFEPVYQSGHNMSIPSQGPYVAGQWQTWDALIGGWWSPFGTENFDEGSGVRTLAEYSELFPAASLVDGEFGGIRLSTGCGGAAWAGFVGNVDNVTIGNAARTVTYDFEAVAPPTPTTPATTAPTTSAMTPTTAATTAPTTASTTPTPTTEIPFFPTWAAVGMAALIGVGGAFLLLRRRDP